MSNTQAPTNKGLAHIFDGRVVKLWTLDIIYPFGIISENTKLHPLPDGFYIVQILEIRVDKRGKEYPYCKMIKKVDLTSFYDLVINLTEINSKTAKFIIELIQTHTIINAYALQRLKKLVKIIIFDDEKIDIFPEVQIKDISDIDSEDIKFLQQDFDIDAEKIILKLNQLKETKNEVCRDLPKWFD
jgi:hypothetical protein